VTSGVHFLLKIINDPSNVTIVFQVGSDSTVTALCRWSTQTRWWREMSVFN